MNSATLHALFRSDVRDETPDYLWSDAEIYSYMDDAQRMFCRLQGGIADSTSAITQLSVTAGDQYVDVSPLILKIRAAYLSITGRELRILNFEDLEFSSMVDDYGYQLTYQLFSTTPGPIQAIVSGMETNKLRLISIPEEDQVINLITYRQPLVEIVPGPPQEFEIDIQHHRHLLTWMKYLAHSKQDAETYDRGRADMFRDEFLAYCDQAKAEREKREHKYRTVRYGGY